MEDEFDLLDGENILAVSEGREQLDRVVLTGDGFIAKFDNHDFEGVSKLHRLISLFEIETVKYEPGKINNNWKKIVRLTILVTALYYLYDPFSRGFDVFWYGASVWECYDGSATIAMERFYDGIQDCADGSDEKMVSEDWFLMFGWLAPVIVYVIGERLGLAPVNGSLRIKHRAGEMRIWDHVTHFVNDGILLVISWFWCNFTSWRAGSEGFYSEFIRAERGSSWIFYLVGFIVLFYCYRILTSKEADPKERALSRKPDNYKFHLRAKAMLGIADDEEGMVPIYPLKHQLKPRILDFTNHLEKYEEDLLLIDRDWDDCYEKAPSPYLGVLAIRTTLESLLSLRIRKVLPKRSNPRDGLQNWIELLSKHDPALKGNRKIRANMTQIQNVFKHEKTNTNEEYLTMLNYFVNIVEWYFENPIEMHESTG